MSFAIICLQDDDFPAHPNEVVTARSLKRAFEADGMTRANAESCPNLEVFKSDAVLLLDV